MKQLQSVKLHYSSQGPKLALSMPQLEPNYQFKMAQLKLKEEL